MTLDALRFGAIYDNAEAERQAAARPTAPSVRGLAVWASRSGDRWWSPVTGDVPTPPGWAYLPCGDGVLTARVRRGDRWWKALRKGDKYTRDVGTVAPTLAIEAAQGSLVAQRQARVRACCSDDPEELAELATSRDVVVRTTVAANRACPVEVLVTLAGARAGSVRTAARANPALPDYLRAILVLGE